MDNSRREGSQQKQLRVLQQHLSTSLKFFNRPTGTEGFQHHIRRFEQRTIERPPIELPPYAHLKHNQAKPQAQPSGGFSAHLIRNRTKQLYHWPATAEKIGCHYRSCSQQTSRPGQRCWSWTGPPSGKHCAAHLRISPPLPSFGFRDLSFPLSYLKIIGRTNLRRNSISE